MAEEPLTMVIGVEKDVMFILKRKIRFCFITKFVIKMLESKVFKISIFYIFRAEKIYWLGVKIL